MPYKGLAPIGIGTYSRLSHLKKTIESLKRNTLAKESELYIFSDAPQKGDEAIVRNLRKYIHTVSGFRNVYIVERKVNGRVENNRGGQKQLLKEYGKCIFMEDDIVTAPGYLQFMNDGLNYYKDNKSVFSIVGYAPPFDIKDSYDKDYFSLQRFCGWGTGMWADRYHEVEVKINMKKYTTLLNDKSLRNKFSEYGWDMFSMLNQEVNGDIDALDVKIMFHQFWTKQLTIYPKQSLVQNIGHDGSGVHCGITDKFHNKELWKKNMFTFKDDIKPEPNIVRQNYLFRFLLTEESVEFIVDQMDYVLQKEECSKINIWGLGNFCDIVFEKIKEYNIEINYIIDSKARDQKIIYKGFQVLTPEEALKEDLKNIIITSINNRNEIENIIDKTVVERDLPRIRVFSI